MRIFEVDHKQIEKLNDVQLSELLLKLLHLEARKYQIPSFSIEGSLKINVSDDGIDASICWDGNPKATSWLPKNLCIFQCKATNLAPAQCGKEILVNKKLKPFIEKILDAKGAYIIFMHKACNEKMIKERIKKIRDALKKAGKKYFNSAEIHIYDANKIATWVNEFLPAIKYVCSATGRTLHIGANIWSGWERYEQNQIKYVENEKLARDIRQIRSNFKEARAVARITGLSGLGKTRLALEAFRPPVKAEDDLQQFALSAQVIYLDASNTSNLATVIKEWRTEGLSGILIIDNCDIDLHQTLEKEIKHLDNNNLSLLTLDYNSEKVNINSNYIELEPVSDEVIKGILKQSFVDLKDGDIERIVQFSQGFPQIAAILAQARLKGVHDIGTINDDNLLKKMLWGRGPENSEAKLVISACALFERLGFSDELAFERAFVAEKICKIEEDKFYEHAKTFIERGLLDKRGRLIRVVPLPLAVRLAADWWEKCSPQRALRLLTEMPPNLVEPLCNQMRRLHFLLAAQEITKNLCGEKAPFGQAEILNSEQGSRVFRSLVEVNPVATAEALIKAFDHFTKEELLQVGPGRRNLVCALEKLSFWEQTFPVAARILFKFAVAENESWGNNATNQFYQLFHVFLSGTQAPPETRLELIDEFVNSSIPEERLVAITALGHALRPAFFSRMAGVETQGSRAPQKEWSPKRWGDVFDYWREALNRLLPIAKQHGRFSELAKEQFKLNLQGLVRYGLLKEIDFFLKEVTKEHPYWPDALDQIKAVKRFEGNQLPDEGKKIIDAWLALLEPKGMRDKLNFFVSKPSFNDFKEGKSALDIAEKRAIDLAKECSQNIVDLLKNLDVLLKGQQREGYSFGYKLGTILSDPTPVIEQAIAILKSADPNETNINMLGGFLSALRKTNHDLVNATINTFLIEEKLNYLCVKLIATSKPDEADLEKILNLLKQKKIKLEDVGILSYGSVLDHLEISKILKFCSELEKFGIDGVWISIELLFLYSFIDKEKLRWNTVRKKIRSLILGTHIFSSLKRETSSIELHGLIEFSKKLLSEKSDSELAQQIARDLVDLCSYSSFRIFNAFELVELLEILSEKYMKDVWPIFGNALLSSNQILSINMKSFLKGRSDLTNEGFNLKIPNDVLVSWSKEHPKYAPYIIFEIIPIFLEDEHKKFVWNPLITNLIYLHGSNSELLDFLTYRILNFGWSGSPIPTYQKELESIEHFLRNENSSVSKWAFKTKNLIIKEIENERRREKESF